MKHNDNDICMRARSTRNKKKRLLSAFLSFSIVLSLFSSSSMASVEVNTGASLSAPPVTGTFSVSAETAGSYVEPTNTFSDGTVSYYLITLVPANATLTSVTYDGVDYPLTSVCVTSDISQATYKDSNGLIKSIFAANSTVFFDSGTYNDSSANEYTRFSNPNFSMVGLYPDANGEPSAKITKSVRTDGMIERNIVMHHDIYYSNLIFDGLGKNLVSGSRGENAFAISGGDSADHSGSSGFVMKNCIVQNYGSSNSGSSNKNVAFLFFQTAGQHNFENLKIRGMMTQYNYGMISFNQATGNYFRNVSIDGSLASSSVTAIKVESADPYVFAGSQVKNTFTGTLTASPSGSFSRIYIQDYGYNILFPQITGPSDVRYMQYSTTNGYNIRRTFFGFTYYDTKVAAYASADLPAAAANTAVLDLKDNYWIVRSGSSVSVSAQLTNIKSVLTNSAAAASSVPSANIKIAASSDTLDAFTVPDFGDIDVNITAVLSGADPYNSTAPIPMIDKGTITLPAANYQRVRLYNFDFDTYAKYTLQEAKDGIDPASVTLTDPNETGSITGYPLYSTYSPSAVTAAKVIRSSTDTFVNCRFTSLTNEIKMINTAAKLAVGSSATFKAGLTGSDTNSYTGSGYDGNIKDTADDPTINWYSSDPEIVSIDGTTGLAEAKNPGTVTITAKAMDANNDGEIERPFAIFQMQAVSQFTVTYYGNNNTGGILSSPVNTYLDGDTITILDKDTLFKDSYMFIGWNTTESGDGTVYHPGDTLKITGDMDLFAQWEYIVPTLTPTDVPTVAPTDVPTITPTDVPTITPTDVPTITPTDVPTITPTDVPTITPTDVPTITPTGTPTGVPTITPTDVPTVTPTVVPTVVPPAEPTPLPVITPTASPTPIPSPSPTAAPVTSPAPGSGVLGADRNTTPVPTTVPVPSTGVLGADHSLTRTGEMGSITIAFGGCSALLSGGLMLLLVRRRKK